MKYAFMIAASFVAVYAMVAFILYDHNPANWSEAQRGGVVFLGTLTAWSVCYFYDINKKYS